MIEDASTMLRSVGAIERGAASIRLRYQEMRSRALELIDETRERADCEERRP